MANIRKPSWAQTWGTQVEYTRRANRTSLTPRVAHALRLYSMGTAPTKKKAAEMVGLTPATLYGVTGAFNGNNLARRFLDDTSAQIHERAIDVGALLHRLSIEAIGTIDKIRRDGTTEDIRLKAAIDLADRGPQTGKIQKHQVESFTLAGKDVENIRRAMLEGADVHALYNDVTQDFEQVTSTAVSDAVTSSV